MAAEPLGMTTADRDRETRPYPNTRRVAWAVAWGGTTGVGLAMTVGIDGGTMQTIQELAQEVWNPERSIADAVEAFMERIDTDPDLFKVLSRPLLISAVHHEVERLMREQREAFWPRRSRAEPRGDTVAAFVQRARENLFKYPLPNGEMLGSATRPTIVSAASHLINQGRTCYKRGYWLELVALALPSDTVKVGVALKNTDLEQLQQQAEDHMREVFANTRPCETTVASVLG